MSEEEPRQLNASRRTVLKHSAVGLSISAIPASNAVADSSIPDATSVRPESEASALSFAESYLKLETKAKAKTAWQQLSEEQAEAVTRAIQNNIEIRHQRTLKQGSGTSDVTTQGIPVSYSDKVQHLVESAVIYELEHTIDWVADTTNDAVSQISRSTNGRSPPPFWEYRGVEDSDLNTETSYFDSYVEGKVDHTQPVGGTYYPYLELRGEGDGTGTTLQADNGF